MPTLVETLHSSRFTEMSPFMTAVVAYVFGESWTDLPIAEMAVSETEDPVYIRRAGAVGFDGVQNLTDLRNNWNRLLDAPDLTADDRREAVRLSNQRVTVTPGTNSYP